MQREPELIMQEPELIMEEEPELIVEEEPAPIMQGEPTVQEELEASPVKQVDQQCFVQSVRQLRV